MRMLLLSTTCIKNINLIFFEKNVSLITDNALMEKIFWTCVQNGGGEKT